MMSAAIARAVEIAEASDAGDVVAGFREEFCLPQTAGGKPAHYLCGHSLGPLPRRARQSVDRELDRWSRLGVDGHFDADDGWFGYHERFAAPLARLLGAEAREIVAMNSLTVNLHLMLASFFRPDSERRKIVIEKQAFPSDRYAVQSQLALHDLDREAELIELNPISGQLTADALDDALTAENGRVALVLLPGVQYLTGEAVDLTACAAVARRHGCRIGFDLAHAVGNLALDLRAAEPDFAVWCSYKYLNGGPGAIGGCFVNRRWIGATNMPRLEGWWGHDKSSRFGPNMRFKPIDSAEAWQLSNPPILAMAPLAASLELFSAAGIETLREKSIALTSFLEATVATLCGDRAELISPADPATRGAQLSYRLRIDRADARNIAAELKSRDIVADWREPDVLRLAPAPLFNTYADALAAARALADVIGD